MDLKELQAIVEAGESETVEFKKSTAQLPRAGETLCAFLNGNGGQVLIGVTATGKVIGQEVSDATLRDVAATLGRIEPPARVGIRRVSLSGGQEVLVLVAPEAAGDGPFVYSGRPYRRIGPTTSVMPQQEYQRLLLERGHSRNRWENRPAEGFDIEDLDGEEILKTVRLGIAAGRLPEATGADLGSILDRLKLREEGRLLDAAVVLFAGDPLPDYPQCKLSLARFKGVEKTEFLDNRQVHGHAFHLLEEGMAFLLRHLPIAGRFEPGRIERIDEPLFPVAALREALVNALCHRDYAITGGSVSAAIFDDRLEIWSDGILPFGLKPEDLRGPHKSRPRNPLVTGVFYRRGLVEEWGRGTQMIVDLCVRAGHPEPEFVEETGAFGVRFLPSGYIAPHRVAHDLTDRQREILHVLASKRFMALREIVAALQDPPSDRRLREELLHLKRLGLTRQSGHGRGSTWALERADEQ